MNREYILQKLSEIDKQEYSVLELGLFGSYAKNEATENSDIDILVKMDFKKGMYHNFCILHKKLEDLFQQKVDLVDKGSFEYRFQNEKVAAYKQKIKEEILGSVIYV